MRKGKSLFACGVAVVVTAAVLLIGVGPAFAAPPPFEPDPNAASPYGRIVFYDSLGNVLTGGTNLSHLADYAAATTTKDTGATLATLYFAAPDHTKVTSLWTAGQASGSTVFPNASAPVPIKGPGFANPLVTLDATAGDADLASFIATIASPDTTTGYANVWQVRLKDSGPGGAGSGTHYWETDVIVSGSSWSVLDPTITTTSTSITTVPANGGSAPTGTNVSLSATVSPASNGSVQFFDGTTTVGSSHAVTTGSPTATDTATAPAVGGHTYKAVFTPTGGTLVQGSTSPTSTVTITSAPATANNVSSATPQTMTAPNLGTNTITINYGTANDSKGNPEIITGNMTVVTPPTHGTANGTSAGHFSYTNTDGTATSDSFVVAGATVTCSPACSNQPLTGNNITVNVTISPSQPPSIDGAIAIDVHHLGARKGEGRVTATVTNVGSTDFMVCDRDVNWTASTGNVGPAIRPTCVMLAAGSSQRFTYIYSYSAVKGTEVTLTALLAIAGDNNPGNDSSSVTTSVQ